jgi:hypothetical protein
MTKNQIENKIKKLATNKRPNVINLTNHTPFLIFYNGCIFFKVKEGEKRGKENTLLELHRALGREKLYIRKEP